MASRSGEIRFNEPGGQWILSRNLILALYDKHRSPTRQTKSHGSQSRTGWAVSARARYYFDPQSECGALAAVIASLETAVRGSQISDRTALASELRESLTLCP